MKYAFRFIAILSLCGASAAPYSSPESRAITDPKSLLKKDGKTVDAHYYPNEGHGFKKRENRIDAIRRSVDWFDKYLK